MGNHLAITFLAIFFSSLIFTPNTLKGQDVPNTQLFLFDYELSEDGELIFSKPKWFSSFNPNGYNNQPYFHSGWWYFSARLADSIQNDIYAGHPTLGEMRQITATKDSEYSPTPIDKRKLSVVRVEKDLSQRLWSYSIGNNWQREVLFPEVKNVGYHKWFNDSTAIFFIVSDPVSLQMGTNNGSKLRFVTSKIGRGLAIDGDGQVYFTQRMVEDTPWQLKSWSPGNSRPKSIIACPPGGVDFVLLEDQFLLMSSGQKFYSLNLSNQNAGWKEAADFSRYGWPKVTRIAVNDSGQMMVVVNFSN